MDDVLEKITGFITRENYGKMELLFLDHPKDGIQIPAGIVEEGEAHLTAVIRKVKEDTGLSQVKLRKLISYLDLELPNDRHIVLNQGKVYARPDNRSHSWAELRRGLTVTGIQKRAEFTQIEYIEYDQSLEINDVAYQIIGWIPTKSLTQNSRRYFYHLTCEQEAPKYWEHSVDNDKIKLFWAPLTNLPDLLPSQISWLRYFFNYMENKCKYKKNI
ncbi:ADP-ribose pyrophosphatase YjhB (NUDIX family) [Anaerosolibacter carboniphilus]|uniref:ADP-ribose pyrophosphatase YjhB (NUDIX family) n=1 Tax=Anaerosolibacter carboniphilus TaxID=1417629 RepID=A0A841L0J4_9FIRM|nr:NUDIX domain-containing protein [Anaerosolibacter carboniphilus]MBB6215905.1 ADP-ribose pyrophosphatase YjhB (NUDIX family) [Anaerosolibacter carboniphilus]